MPRAGCSRSPIAPDLIFKFQLHGFWCALSNAVTSLATMIRQRVIFHNFPIFLLLNSARCFEVPAETHFACAWDEQARAIQRPTLSSAVVCSVVTANRCDVATHVATLVFGCEVWTGCESLGRHSLHRLKCPIDASQLDGILCCGDMNMSLSSSSCERHC